METVYDGCADGVHANIYCLGLISLQYQINPRHKTKRAPNPKCLLGRRMPCGCAFVSTRRTCSTSPGIRQRIFNLQVLGAYMYSSSSEP